MSGVLNFAAGGLLFGLIAAAAVELLAIRWPRLASLLGTAAFPLVALAPLLGSRQEVAIPLDDRGLDAMVRLVCVVVALALVARELAGQVRAARERRGWTLAPWELRTSLGVDALYVAAGQPPAVHGVFRRSIVVPSPDVSPRVLLHELAHYRWRDPMLIAVRRLMRAAFWFHPGLLLLDRATRLAGELAADAAALAATTAPERAAFASLLVSAARSASSAPALGARNARDLEVRIRAILGRHRVRRAAARALVLAAALAALPIVPHFVAHDEVVIRRVIRIR